MKTKTKETKLITFRSTIDQIKTQKELSNSLEISISDMIKMAIRRLKYDFEHGIKL